MELFVDIMQRLLGAAMQLISNPFAYIGMLIVILQYRKQIQFERKLFHVRLHSIVNESLHTIWWGFLGGLAVSLVFALIGIALRTDTIILLWMLSILMFLFRVRFLCLAYSVGVLAFLHVILEAIPSNLNELPATAGFLYELISNAEIPSLIALVALLHIGEGILIRMQGSRMASPMFFESKRGKIVGGFQLQGFWPIALFLVVPMQASDGGSSMAMAWNPLFGGNLWSHGWGMIGVPAMIGFTEMTVSMLPKQKVKRSSGMLLLYGALLLLSAVLAQYWDWLVIVAALLCIGLHEALIWYSRYEETKRSPLFVHRSDGLTILSVIPGSPAAQLGLEAGEIIHKVNGRRTQTKEELHQAMQLNPTFCKLEMINLEGETKFAQRAVFSGDPYGLGIILAPDEQAAYYVELHNSSAFSYIGSKLSGLMPNRSDRSV